MSDIIDVIYDKNFSQNPDLTNRSFYVVDKSDIGNERVNYLPGIEVYPQTKLPKDMSSFTPEWGFKDVYSYSSAPMDNTVVFHDRMHSTYIPTDLQKNIKVQQRPPQWYEYLPMAATMAPFAYFVGAPTVGAVAANPLNFALSLGGGYVGSNIVNDAVYNISGSKYSSWGDMLGNTSDEKFLYELTNPGGWGFSWATPKVVNNAMPWFKNTLPRTAYGSKNDQVYKVYAGEPTTVKDVEYVNHGRVDNFGKHQGGANRNHTVRSGGQNQYKTTSYGYTPKNSGEKLKIQENQTFVSPQLPYQGATPIPLFNFRDPKFIPPEPTPEVRAEQVEPTITDWQKWFEWQIKHNPGTDQYYEGTPEDPRSGKWYKIVLGGDGQFVKRSVGKQTNGTMWPVATDSTTVRFQPTLIDKKQVKILPGGVHPDARISDTEFINVNGIR